MRVLHELVQISTGIFPPRCTTRQHGSVGLFAEAWTQDSLSIPAKKQVLYYAKSVTSKECLPTFTRLLSGAYKSREGLRERNFPPESCSCEGLLSRFKLDHFLD